MEPDLAAAVDARIEASRARRSTAQRFSNEFWDADDDVTYWRMVRDELRHSGRLREDARDLLVGADGATPRPMTVLPVAQQATVNGGAMRGMSVLEADVDAAGVA